MKKKTHVRIAAKEWRKIWANTYNFGPLSMCENKGKGFVCCRRKGHYGEHLFRDYKYDVTW